ncbi:MAG: hypothetical protein KJN97_02055, partial [Deltaproteobacteria bacterium]|nr:hypothetical protein [Deltaproteobacteria bacterium]
GGASNASAPQLYPDLTIPIGGGNLVSCVIGQKLSHYSIVSKLGEGGMGEVCLAEDLDLKRSVALKVLPSDFADDPERLARFRRNRGAASRSCHARRGLNEKPERKPNKT